jgi:hypothetical protein
MEIKLPTSHLNCDIIIVDKFPGQELHPSLIDNGIAKCLNEVNFFEYKSPHESLTPDVFRKCNSYSDLYLLSKDIPVEKASVIMVTSRHPRELLKYVKKHYDVDEISKGIYSVKVGPIKTYIILLKKIPPEQNLWITSLKLKLPEERYNQVIANVVNRKDENTFQMFINTFLKINKNKFIKGKIKMDPTTLELMEEYGLLEPLIQKGKSDGAFAAKADDIIRALTKRLETPPKKLQDKIRKVRSIEKLDELFDLAITCVSIGEFATALN